MRTCGHGWYHPIWLVHKLLVHRFPKHPLLRICRPNVITYNAAINACEEGLQWEHALSLLRSMSTSKVGVDGRGHDGEADVASDCIVSQALFSLPSAGYKSISVACDDRLPWGFASVGGCCKVIISTALAGHTLEKP